MEVTEAPPAMMEVDSTILERVEKVCAKTKFREAIRNFRK